MRKFSLVLALALVFAMTFTFVSEASPWGITENPPIAIPKATPTIDGNIDPAEGWSSVALMNLNTLGFFWKQNPLTSDGNVWFAYDDDNLYYCAKITENLQAVNEVTGEVINNQNTVVPSPAGSPTLDLEDDGTSLYGCDGDVFGLMLDPLGALLDAGFVSNQDYSTWYMVGIDASNNCRMYRSKWNPGEITDKVQVKGQLGAPHATIAGTYDSWQFEASIPWDEIIKDAEAAGQGDVTIDKASLLSSGAHIRAAAMYQDRFIVAETGQPETWGRFITVPKVCMDGLPGNGSSGDHVLGHGLNLFIDQVDASKVTTYAEDPGQQQNTTAPTNLDPNAGAEGSDTTTAADPNANTPSGGNNNGGSTVNKTPTANKPASTTKAQSTGTATGGDAAQTFDIGVAAAFGALATSAIGFYTFKKRK